MKKTLYIFIGASKVNCENLIYTLGNQENRSILSANSIEFLPEGSNIHKSLVNNNYQELDKIINNIKQKVNSDERHTKFLFASPAFFQLSQENSQYIYDKICKNNNDFKVKIIVFVRRQDDVIYEWYAPFITNVNVNKKLTDLITAMSDQKDILNHEVSINKWESIFGKENIIVKLYKNVDNTITETFSILGFNTIDSKIKLVNEEFPILNPEQLILLKHCKNLINIDHFEILKKRINISVSNYQSVLSPKLREKILNEYSKSNNNIAKKYFNQTTLFDSYIKDEDENEWDKLDIFENGYFDKIMSYFKNTNKDLYDALKNCEFNKIRPNEYMIGQNIDNLNLYLNKKKNLLKKTKTQKNN